MSYVIAYDIWKSELWAFVMHAILAVTQNLIKSITILKHLSYIYAVICNLYKTWKSERWAIVIYAILAVT